MLSVFFLLMILVVQAENSQAQVNSSDRKIDFASQIKPLLANHCWSCHGPDEQARQADLRLDLREEAVSSGSIVPGAPERSSLVERIHSKDPNLVMPPPESKKDLTDAQRELLVRWIAQDAPYAQHWAFLPVTPPNANERHAATPTAVASKIDNIVQDQLAAHSIHPSPKANRETLLRRLSLDLTGLPASQEETERYLQDPSADATERLVDRLLSTTAYAERMASQWLDLARYADTNGYNNDEDRQMWPWRDWVIDAYHRNLPFDQFLTEQLAGDLLPNATLEQRIATGFLRNQGHNTEGGIIQEEYRVEYVADRVHTTATVFLGLSLQCARCHDHKVDPFSQSEYYKFFSLFNNLEEKQASYSNFVGAEPFVRVPTSEQKQNLDALRAEINAIEAQVAAYDSQVQSTWNDWIRSKTDQEIQTALGAVEKASISFDESLESSRDETLAGSNSPWENPKEFLSASGRKGQSVSLSNGRHLVSKSLGQLSADRPFSWSVWVHPTAEGSMAVFSRMDETQQHRGFDLLVVNGKVEMHLVDQWPSNALKVSTQQTIAPNQWHHLGITYDGSKKAAGIRITIDGKQTGLDVPNNSLSGSIETEQPFRLGLRQQSLPFQGMIDELILFEGVLSPESMTQLANLESPKFELAWVRKPWTELTPEQTEQAKRWTREIVRPEHGKQITAIAEKRKKLTDIEQSAPAVMVLQEMQPARETFILKRGQYDQPTTRVDADVPEALKFDKTSRVANRLELARWLTHSSNPLTARVVVNRLWEQCFGAGIVRTSEDFGGTGELPSQLELLDLLADAFIQQGWDTKAMLKSIVLSETYQQESRLREDLRIKDPENRWLARGPRHRLSAEVIRDNALAISGLLVRKVGGPSVKPYQPDGLWEDVTVERRGKYVADTGENLYRRGMYTFWKRTCPPPAMVTFDAPNREVCVARRSRTNTPLQALVLLNDPCFVEAARAFAADVLRKGGPDDLSKIRYAVSKAIVRAPYSEEIPEWLGLIQQARDEFADSARASEFLKVGTLPVPTDLPANELASWTLLCSTLLNLDETITKY
jgi:mono/diheme cytochrome c family protein